jgi:formylglycine-generating enzyme required for sulfatase activity
LAIAPFDAAQAKWHQQAWAEYLGVPVERANSMGMRFVLIPPGEFMMQRLDSEGHREEGPQHRVRITKQLYLQTTEVTQGQWETVMGTRPWNGQANVREGSDFAATYISWQGVQGFCARLSERERVAYRVPTEAEWEYACRAGSTAKYHFGDDASRLGEHAWFGDNAASRNERYAHRVGYKKPGPFGLYDMHGNVWEWCQDWFVVDYDTAASNDPVGPPDGSARVTRSGGWGDWAGRCRAAYRRPGPKTGGGDSSGFRVCFEVK